MGDEGQGDTMMAAPSSSSSAPAPSSFQYPYATSPDIIRSNQKDTYFQAVLLEHLSTILRNLKGARFIHSYTGEAKLSADLLYLGLTTLVGNRTLGEEYCDIVQVESGTSRLPSMHLRAGYIASTILLPYVLNRVLPLFRRRLRAALEANLAPQQPRPSTPSGSSTTNEKQRQQQPRKPTPSRTTAIQQYLLANLDTITSPSPIYALSLATFYFSGAYYHLSKRLLGLRYIFTRKVAPSDQRAGYEVLGVLLVLQLSVQAYLHLHSTLSSSRTRSGALDAPPIPANAPTAIAGGTAVLPGNTPGGDIEVSLDPASYSSNNTLLFESGGVPGGPSDEEHSASQARISRSTHTPLATLPRIDLGEREKGKGAASSRKMRWLEGRQARKCTLCLEPMKDPSATTCGHLFCWACIVEWLGEKQECPLCRQQCLAQHVLPLR